MMLADPLHHELQKLGSADAQRQARAAIARAEREGWAQWIRGVVDLRAMAEGYWFDVSAAERVQAFFCEVLRLKDPLDPRKSVPFEPYEWQYRDVLAPLFGWKRPDGTRRFRKGDVWVPKKNGKTPLASGIVLYMMIGDGEPEPELYSVATTIPQAALVYKEASKMVKKSPSLQKIIKPIDHKKRMEVEALDAFYQVLSSDADAADGINAHAAVFDELHRQKNRELFNTLQYAFAARRQPMLLIISTAGDDLESIGFERFEIARKIVAGDVVDHEHFAFIAAADDKDDWRDPEVWAKANPSLGLTISHEDMASACQSAIDNPSEQPNFRRLRLNQWVGRGSSFIDMDKWRQLTGEVNPAELVGQPAWGGLDLSSNTDLTSFYLKFNDGDRRKVLGFNWMPEKGLAHREKQDGVPYRRWVDEGRIKLTPGDWIDLDMIRRDINEIAGQYAIAEIAFDPAFASQICVQLANDGFEVFRFKQSSGMMTPVLAELDRLIRAGLLDHGGDPVLQWAASNLTVRNTSDGLLKPIKASQTLRIDPIVALTMSLGVDVKPTDTDLGPDEEYQDVQEMGRAAITTAFDEEYGGPDEVGEIDYD